MAAAAPQTDATTSARQSMLNPVVRGSEVNAADATRSSTTSATTPSAVAAKAMMSVS